MSWDDDERNEPVDVEVDEVLRILPNSLIVEVDGMEVQIPFSQIDASSEIGRSSEPGASGTLTIPRWLARNENIEP